MTTSGKMPQVGACCKGKSWIHPICDFASIMLTVYRNLFDLRCLLQSRRSMELTASSELICLMNRILQADKVSLDALLHID